MQESEQVRERPATATWSWLRREERASECGLAMEWQSSGAGLDESVERERQRVGELRRQICIE